MKGAAASNGSVASAPGSLGVGESGSPTPAFSPEHPNSQQRKQQPGRATVYDGVHADLTGKIINAAIEVHTELGCGLKEDAYEAALAWELTQRGHKVLRQVPCPVVYKGNVFCQDDEHPKRIDLLVDDRIVVELKAVCTRHPVFAAQCRTYLRMLNLPAGLVLNFGFPSLREGIEHVSNPKATPLHNSKTPSSDSNTGDRLLPPRRVSEIRDPDSQPPPPPQNNKTPSRESKENGK